MRTKFKKKLVNARYCYSALNILLLLSFSTQCADKQYSLNANERHYAVRFWIIRYLQSLKMRPHQCV